jgi:hypothetical protein
MNVTVIVTWQGGLVTRHEIRGLPGLSAEGLAELLDKDLASYLDPGELPMSPDGCALGWVSVDVELVSSDERH